MTIVGDGGLMLMVGELATLAQESLDMTLVVMNDGGYGVVRGIQKKYFDGRQYYNDLHTPDFQTMAAALDLPHWKVSHGDGFQAVIAEAVGHDGPAIVEVDMNNVGPLEFGALHRRSSIDRPDQRITHSPHRRPAMACAINRA